MNIARLILIPMCLVVAACGGSPALECDSGPYQVAVSTPRVIAPEGLDNLDPLNEVPLPSASPQEPWPEDGPCLEHPPQLIIIE